MSEPLPFSLNAGILSPERRAGSSGLFQLLDRLDSPGDQIVETYFEFEVSLLQAAEIALEEFERRTACSF